MKRICILYYNAGAGHRAAATALYREFKNRPQVKVELVNFIEDYHVKGFEHASESYKFSLKYLSLINGLIVWSTNQKPVLGIIRKTYTRAAHKHFPEFLKDHPADVYISTCYYENELFDYIKQERPEAKTVMVVTDLAYPLRIWFSDKRDLTILPSTEIYHNAGRYFSSYKDKVRVMGLPVAPEFFQKGTISMIKRQLHLPNLPTILVSGGGEGMDNIPAIVSALDMALDKVSICIVCGKDTRQRQKLAGKKYKNNVIVLGWTDQFANYLLASDLVITKAGATTIWEAMTARKKTIIFDRIRGQEDGNVEFAKKYFQARYCTNPRKIAATAKLLLNEKQDIKYHAYMENWTKKIADAITD